MNRTQIRNTAVALALVAALAAPAWAQPETGGGPGEWYVRYTSARALGLGGAMVAFPGDPLGVVWNPAGLALLDQNELRAETAQLFEDTSVQSLSFAVPGSRFPTFGVTMLSLRSGEFQKTNEMNDDLGSFHESETAWLLTASKNLSPRLAVGANFKLVQQTVEQWSSGGFGADVGAVWALTPRIRVAASLANLGGPNITLRDTGEPWPVQMRAGFSTALLDGRAHVMAELDQSTGLGTRIRGGSEYWLVPTLALRVGYDESRGTGGFTYRFGPAYQLDYGVADHALGLTHRVGLSYRFGGFFSRSTAEPEVFSPTGERAVTKITLHARTKSAAESWTLDILGKSDEIVRRFGGKGQPPAHVEWDGKDETGLPLADGVYRYRLTVVDRDGRVMLAPMRTLEISTGGPQGAVPVVPVP